MAETAGLYYEDHDIANGPPLILSSGLGGSAGYWSPNLGTLSAYHRVIIYDHRGTGRSDRALPETVTLADLGADILALMNAIGLERASVIGHAIGGMAALEAARVAPERIDRIVVINGWVSLDPWTARCFDTRLTLLRKAGPEAYLEAQPLFLYPPVWLAMHQARIRAETAQHLAHWPGDATMEKRIAAARAFDGRPWLESIHSRTLVMCTGDDLLVPYRNSDFLTSLIPNASQYMQLSGGHAFNVTDCQGFHYPVLKFLRS